MRFHYRLLFQFLKAIESHRQVLEGTFEPPKFVKNARSPQWTAKCVRTICSKNSIIARDGMYSSLCFSVASKSSSVTKQSGASSGNYDSCLKFKPVTIRHNQKMYRALVHSELRDDFGVRELTNRQSTPLARKLKSNLPQTATT